MHSQLHLHLQHDSKALNAADRRLTKITQTLKINKVVYLWPTLEPIIKEKADILSKKFPVENKGFKASEGVEAMLYCDELADTISDYGYWMDSIFNAGETCLNYKMLSSKTLAAKADREAPRAKKCKEHTTVLTYTNAYQSFRLPLLVIGKSEKPNASNNYDFRSSPVVYENEKKSLDGCSASSKLEF